MNTRNILFSIGLFLGFVIVFALGAKSERLELSGELFIKNRDVGIFQSTFSGLTADGRGYLAITNTKSGSTEIFGITKYIRSELKDLPGGRQGSVILDVSIK